MRALVLVVLLAGCAAPVDLPGVPPTPDDGITYTLVRANVTVFPLEWQGRLGAGLCEPSVCRMPAAPVAANTSHAVALEGTWLWHVNATMSWTSSVPTRATLSLYATSACGANCVDWRRIESTTGLSPLALAFKDLALKANETGLALAVSRPPDLLPVSPASDFLVEGRIVSLRPEL